MQYHKMAPHSVEISDFFVKSIINNFYPHCENYAKSTYSELTYTAFTKFFNWDESKYFVISHCAPCNSKFPIRNAVSVE